MTDAQSRTAELDYLIDRSQWVRTYPAGRRCKSPGCATILSIYNPETLCGAHSLGHRWGQVDPAGEKQCLSCGQRKPLDCFGTDLMKHDGRRAQCRDCFNARRRAKKRVMTPEQRDHYRQYKREWMKRRTSQEMETA